MTKRGFLNLDWKGEGVLGLGLELGVEIGSGTELENLLGFCLEIVGEGEVDVVLEKKEVI